MRDKVPVLFGEVLFDCFEDGSRVLGGAPFNVAWHLQAFGCRPLFISRVGDDPWGRKIRDVMQHWHMTTAGLQKDSAHHTGEVQVTLNQGQPKFEILPDRAYDHIHCEGIPPMSPSLVYHGSLGLRQAESAATLADILNKHPAPVFMDVNLRSPWWDRDQLAMQLDHAHWVKINDAELHMLVDGSDNLQEKADSLRQRHDLTWLIVTLGAQGVFALDQVGSLHETAPAAKIPVVDTVGAGDAFASVCILGILQDWPLTQTLQRAQQFASLVVGQRGATIQNIANYLPFIQAWQLPQ
jgi:fructokinase